MKILWIVNTIFPYPAEKIGVEKTVFGGWLNGLVENLKNKKEIQLAIATTYNGKKQQKFHDGKMEDYVPTDAELQAGFDGIPRFPGNME